jgi:hypothetical protein
MRGSIGINSALITSSIDEVYAVPCTFTVDGAQHESKGLFDSADERVDVASGATTLAVTLRVRAAVLPAGVKRQTRVSVDAADGGNFIIETLEHTGRGRVVLTLSRVRA